MTGRSVRVFTLGAILISLVAAPRQSSHAADADLVIGGVEGAVAPLLGINIGPLGNLSNPDLTSAYQARGLRLIRTHDYYGPLDMATMYPDRSRDPLSPASYNFTGATGAERRSSDTTFAAIINGGFEPYFRLGDSYNNATPPSPAELPNWVQAAVQVLRHYREGQWNGFSSNFRFVEIWNEPNGLLFWPLSREEYFALYVQTAHALRAAFPELKIGGPGVNPAGCKSPTGQEWVRAFLDAVRANGAPLDFFSWHLYSNEPAQYSACAAFFRNELDSRGFTATEQHVTEWNTDTTSDVDLRAGARGAAINTAAWINMQRSGVAQEMFYRGPEPDPNAPFFHGMFRANGEPKKVGLAAELWSAVTAYPSRLAVTGGASQFSALAVGDNSGGVAVLVANTSSATRTWSLAGAGLPAASTFTVQTVSDASATVQTTTTTTATFTIPSYGVQLVRMGTASGPSAPTGLTASVTGNLVTLRWVAPAEAVSDYLLEVGSTSGSSNVYSSPVGATTSLSATAPAGTFYARVRARIGGVLSSASNEVIFTVGGCAGLAAPGGVSGAVTAGTARVQWNPVSGATSYVVRAGTVSGAANYFNGNVGAATAVSARVAAGFSAYVRVSAVNACGEGSPSTEILLR